MVKLQIQLSCTFPRIISRLSSISNTTIISRSNKKKSNYHSALSFCYWAKQCKLSNISISILIKISFPFMDSKVQVGKKKSFILAKLVKGLPFCLLGQVLMVSCSFESNVRKWDSLTLCRALLSQEKRREITFSRPSFHISYELYMFETSKSNGW